VRLLHPAVPARASDCDVAAIPGELPGPAYAGSEPADDVLDDTPAPINRPIAAAAPDVRAELVAAGTSFVSGVQRQASPVVGRLSLVAAPATPTVRTIPPMALQRITLIRSITSLSRYAEPCHSPLEVIRRAAEELPIAGVRIHA
jgi:hypothetical protein